MIIFFKKINEAAKEPTSSEGNAGYDLYSCEDNCIQPQTRELIKTGIKLVIPNGYYGHISDRSGMAFKYGAHCLGKIIDSNYRGEIGVILLNTDKDKEIIIKKGDRIAQIIFKKYEEVQFSQISDLPDSNRNENGFGSSGR
jgi:dUTP pyrophosphatase